MRISFFLALVLTFVLIASVAVVQVDAQETGKCVPIPTFDGNFDRGYTVPVCANQLRLAGYTHFWAPDSFSSQIPQGKESDPQCLQELFYNYDSIAQELSSAFTADKPSTTCQNGLMTLVCLHAVPICDISKDIGTYQTKEVHKVCPWVCDLFRSNMDDICSDDDLDYLLNEHGLDIRPQTYDFWPQLNCKGDRYATPEAETIFQPNGQPSCIAPTFLSTEPVASRCEEYTGAMCSGVFPTGTYIHIPAGTDQNTIEQLLASSAYLLNALPLQSNSHCASDMVKLYCQAMFRECLDVPANRYPAGPDGYPLPNSPATTTPIALPLNPPMASCTEFQKNCQDTPMFQLFTALTQQNQLIDCPGAVFTPITCLNPSRSNSILAPYIVNQKSFFNPFEYSLNYFTAPDGVYTTTSYAATQATFVNSLPYVDGCVAPLVIAPADVNGINTVFGTADHATRCMLPCPSPAYSHNERNNIEIAAWFFIIFGLVFSAILAITFTIFHSQRHKYLLFYYSLSYFGAILFLFIGMLVRTNNSIWKQQCNHLNTYKHMDGFGLAQAIIVVYFLCCASNWWLMQAIDLFQRLILGLTFRRGTQSERRRRFAMHLFCWLSPWWVVGAALTARQFGYDGILPFAWYVIDPNVDSSVNFSRYNTIIVFFIHLIISILVAFGLIGTVLVYLIKYTETKPIKKFVDTLEDKDVSSWYKLQQLLKLLGFAIVPVLFYISIIVYYATTSIRQDNWDNALDAWAKELVLSFNGVNYFSDLATPGLADKMPTGLSIFLTFGLCSQGFIIFFLYFVLSSDVYGLWMGLFYYKLGIQCCKRFAKEDTTTGSDASGSGGSGGSNSSHGSTQLTGRSGVSNDLISGGGMLLTKKARDKAAQENNSASGGSVPHTNNSSAADSAQNPSAATISSVSKPTSSLARKTLFKGMSNPNQDNRWQKKGNHSSSGSSVGLEMATANQPTSYHDEILEIGEDEAENQQD